MLDIARQTNRDASLLELEWYVSEDENGNYYFVQSVDEADLRSCWEEFAAPIASEEFSQRLSSTLAIRALLSLGKLVKQKELSCWSIRGAYKS